MTGPTVATIKRLFAVCGNQCAFPRCSVSLVDPSGGKVTAKICHIKGRKPGSARYDPDQTDEERHAFDNLLILCPIHHDVVDDDPDSYSVDRLRQIKAAHEGKDVCGSEPPDGIAQQLIANISHDTLTHGSVIFTQNQMGGQVAHSITNIGPLPRQISRAAVNALVAELRKQEPENVDIVAVLGDADSYNLAGILDEIMKMAGWRTDGVSQALFTGQPTNVILEAPQEKPSLLFFLNWLHRLGLKPSGILNPNAPKPKLVVGPAA